MGERATQRTGRLVAPARAAAARPVLGWQEPRDEPGLTRGH